MYIYHSATTSSTEIFDEDKFLCIITWLRIFLRSKRLLFAVWTRPQLENTLSEATDVAGHDNHFRANAATFGKLVFVFTYSSIIQKWISFCPKVLATRPRYNLFPYRAVWYCFLGCSWKIAQYGWGQWSKWVHSGQTIVLSSHRGIVA